MASPRSAHQHLKVNSGLSPRTKGLSEQASLASLNSPSSPSSPSIGNLPGPLETNPKATASALSHADRELPSPRHLIAVMTAELENEDLPLPLQAEMQEGLLHPPHSVHGSGSSSPSLFGSAPPSPLTSSLPFPLLTTPLDQSMDEILQVEDLVAWDGYIPFSRGLGLSGCRNILGSVPDALSALGRPAEAGPPQRPNIFALATMGSTLERKQVDGRDITAVDHPDDTKADGNEAVQTKGEADRTEGRPTKDKSSASFRASVTPLGPATEPHPNRPGAFERSGLRTPLDRVHRPTQAADDGGALYQADTTPAPLVHRTPGTQRTPSEERIRHNEVRAGNEVKADEAKATSNISTPPPKPILVQSKLTYGAKGVARLIRPRPRPSLKAGVEVPKPATLSARESIDAALAALYVPMAIVVAWMVGLAYIEAVGPKLHHCNIGLRALALFPAWSLLLLAAAGLVANAVEWMRRQPLFLSLGMAFAWAVFQGAKAQHSPLPRFDARPSFGPAPSAWGWATVAEWAS
ncbi:hypothetical protein CspeluHIS016_0902660 [Cutaneotrichosporon spelunceum]|uniref:Uncharacterized protein n=1 Tax=Cutaneotrichosporon spelunceum TaxID=1672016 RepID=A0AAD3U0H2_9TREE|nr:hypothetical protein CspeluHIS016_0902660 [Cutaneotrichosporon spelunceum]